MGTGSQLVRLFLLGAVLALGTVEVEARADYVKQNYGFGRHCVAGNVTAGDRWNEADGTTAYAGTYSVRGETDDFTYCSGSKVELLYESVRGGVRSTGWVRSNSPNAYVERPHTLGCVEARHGARHYAPHQGRDGPWERC